MTKFERALDLLSKARAMGCEPTLQGSWVVFRPPLPVELLMESIDLGDELAEVLA